MKDPREIVQPIWEKWHNTNEINSKELVIQVWNAAIEASAESADTKTERSYCGDQDGGTYEVVNEQSILKLLIK